MFIAKFTNTEIMPFKKIMLKDAKPIKNRTEYQSYCMYQNYYFQSAVNELMLRKNQVTKTLVLARIKINHRRIGTATKLIDNLEHLARQLNYRYVMIESILSPEMWNLAQTLNYQKKGYDAIKKIKEES
jgi:hypothetical protein